MSQDDNATPAEYALVFEQSKTGQRILEDLTRIFCHNRNGSTGIDRVLDQAEDRGRQQVMQHILNQLNRHNIGEQEDETIEASLQIPGDG